MRSLPTTAIDLGPPKRSPAPIGRILPAFIAVWLGTAVSSLTATTFYVDSVGGNDGNDGQAVSRAWKTIGKVNSESYQRGDRILFRRGQTFGGRLYITSSGTENAPILINPWRLWLSDQEYVLAQSVSDVDTYYRFYYDMGAKILYVYAPANPATFYSDMIGLQSNVSTVQVSNQQHLDFSHLELRGGYGVCLHIWSSHYIKVHDVVIGYTFKGISVNGPDETDQPSSYCEVYDCVLDSQFVFRYNYYGVGIHDGIISTFGHHCVYRNNLIKNWGHTGINLHCTVADARIGTSFNEVYDNVITAPDVSYCRGLSMGGSEGKCRYNRMYRNWVVDTHAQNQLGGDHNQFVYNVIDGIQHPPFKSGSSANGIVLDNSGEVCHDNLYANNVIRNCDGAGVYAANWDPTNPHVYNNTITNNIIINCGLNLSHANNRTVQTWADSSIVVHDHEHIHDNIFANNLVYRSDVQECIHYRGQRLTAAQWNVRNGTGRGDIIVGNIQTDPLFVNASARDFHLQPGSHCIDAGLDVGLTVDFARAPVPKGPHPDIGAYEFGGADGTTLVDTVSTNGYAPTGLELERNYYWKIVEVNGAEAISARAGDVWMFRTEEYAVIDDFESYDDEENRIHDTWLDGWVNQTGSTVGYLEAPIAETLIVHSGAQSMPLHYDNSAAPFYSEAEFHMGGMDLEANGADRLRLSVSGLAPGFLEATDGTQPVGNTPESIYVALEDSTSKVAVVTHPDTSLSARSGWTEWLIPYSDLADINLNSVRTMYIGIGDRNNPTAGGTGAIFVDDVGYGSP